MNGDYFALGLLTDSAALGVYFFGFQLTTAASNPFTSAIQGAVLPGFVRLKDDPERRARAFAMSVRMMLLVAAPTCFLAAAAAPAVIELIWQGRWAEAAPISQLMAVALVTRMAVPMCRAFWESMGRWRFVAIVYCVDGVLMTITAGMSAWLFSGQLVLIALILATYRSLGSFIYVAIAGWGAGVEAKSLGYAFSPVGVHLLAATTASLIVVLAGSSQALTSFEGSVAATALLFIFQLLISVLIFGDDYRSILRRFRGKVVSQSTADL
jgi:O-antigen/teichoic acid export membrane protein